MFRPWIAPVLLLAAACVAAPSANAGQVEAERPRRVARRPSTPSSGAATSPAPIRVRPAFDSISCKAPTALPVLGPSELSVTGTFELVNEVLIGHVRSWIQYFRESLDPMLREQSYCVGFLGEPTLPVGVRLDRTLYVFLGSETLMHLIALSQVRFESWPLTIVIAHEFGHLLQDLHRFRFSAASAHRRESHADCVGGYLTGLVLGFLPPEERDSFARLGSDADLWLHENTTDADSLERRVSFQEGMALASISVSGLDTGLTSGEVLSSCYHRQTPFRLERRMGSDR